VKDRGRVGLVFRLWDFCKDCQGALHLRRSLFPVVESCGCKVPIPQSLAG